MYMTVLYILALVVAWTVMGTIVASVAMRLTEVRPDEGEAYFWLGVVWPLGIAMGVVIGFTLTMFWLSEKIRGLR